MTRGRTNKILSGSGSLVPRYVLPLLGLLLLASCSFDYGADLEDESLLDSTPSLHMTMLHHMVVREGKTIMVIEARDVKVFDRQNRREMDDIRFFQYDGAGVLTAEGKARRAVQDIQTEDVDFQGSVEVQIRSDNSSITGAWLSWKASSKQFLGKEDELIVLQRTDGTRIEGRGMILDTLERSLSFTGGISGTISTE